MVTLMFYAHHVQYSEFKTFSIFCRAEPASPVLYAN